MALIIFFGARAELFGSDFFLLEPEPELFGSDFFFLEPEPSFFALVIFFWSQSRAFGSEFLFWSLSWSLKFWEPTRALIGSLKFLLVSQDPFMDLVIPDFSPLVPQETILISRQEKAGGGGQECLHPRW